MGEETLCAKQTFGKAFQVQWLVFPEINSIKLNKISNYVHSRI